jgi:RNA polymerase sigma-70 factor (ECF subfamily)
MALSESSVSPFAHKGLASGVKADAVVGISLVASCQLKGPFDGGETAGAFESHPCVTIPAMSSDAPSPPPAPVIPLESALVERARRRDEAAFREIFRQHAPRVWRFLRDLLGTGAAADDAAQETFVRAHAALLDGAPIERLAPWLFGVARNVSREHLRARSRTVAMAEPVDGEVPACAADPEALLAGRETAGALVGALAVLSHDRRTALLLRADHELGYDEIAGILGWTLPRVKNEIHRARLQLRAALVDHLNASEDRHGA